MKYIYLHIPELQTGSLPLVLATVISTHGSTPRKPGSSALFDANGLIYGTIGGGVLEGRVQKIAREATRTGESNIYHFELNKDISFRNEAICGGEATVLIDPALQHQPVFLKKVKVLLDEKKPCVLVAIIYRTVDKGVKIDRYIVSPGTNSTLPEQYESRIRTETDRLLSSSNSDEFCLIEIGPSGKEDTIIAFLEPLYPPPELIIAGAGHIGKALSHLGRLLDFEVTIIDDRPEFANTENLPDADHIIVEDIGQAIRKINKTSNTYIVIVTRGHEDDSNALKPCIGSGAAYIGMIGSRTKTEKMRLNFMQNGWADEEEWKKIHTPIGLDIQSETVEEIALSIAAELVLERNKKKRT
jgi:xanthine dehydrogenase accessory factor